MATQIKNESQKPVHGTFKFEGNAATIIREVQAERILKGKPIGVHAAISELLCEAYNRKHGNKTA